MNWYLTGDIELEQHSAKVVRPVSFAWSGESWRTENEKDSHDDAAESITQRSTIEIQEENKATAT